MVDVGLDLGREQALELLPARTVILEAGDVRSGEEQGRLRAGLPHAGHRLEVLPRCGELPTHARVGGEDGGVLGAAGVEGADSQDRGEGGPTVQRISLRSLALDSASPSRAAMRACT